MKYKKQIINYNRLCDNRTDKMGKPISKCICQKCRKNRVWNDAKILSGSKGGFETREQFNKRKNKGSKNVNDN